MAITIPRYDGAQVKSIGIQAPRAQGTPNMFGALGQGIQRAGEVASVIAGDMQKEELQTKAYDFRVTLDDHENSIKFGEPGDDGAEGFLKIEGSESMQYKDTYLEDFKTKAFEAIPKDVPERVRSQFEKIAQERYNSVSNEFNRHAITQERKANDAATGAMEASILRNISQNPYDDDRFQLELATLKHVVDQDVTKKYGEGNAEATAIRKSRLELAVNDAYSKRLNRILLDDPAKGKQFLDDNTGVGTLTPESVDHYKKILEPLVANQDGINAAFEDIPRLKAGEPIDSLIAERQKKLTSRPAVFKVYEAQLRASQSDMKNANIQGAQTAAMDVQKLIIEAEKGGGKMSPVQLLASPEYKALVALGTPEALTLAAGYSDKTYQEHHSEVVEARTIARENRIEGKMNRAEAKQDLVNAQQLEFTRLSLAPDEVASMSPFELGQKVVELGPSLGGQLRTMQATLASPEKLAQANMDKTAFNGLMVSLGIEDKKKQAQYYDKAQAHIISQQQDGKRIFRPDQMRQAVIAAMQDVEVSERSEKWFGDGYNYSTTTKKRIDVQNPEAIIIPKEDLSTVTQFLKDNNFDDTPKNRLRVYDRILSDRGGKKIKGQR